MKKLLQLRTFNLRPGLPMQEDLLAVNTYLRQADIMQAFSVDNHSDNGAILLFLEHIKEGVEVNGAVKESELSVLTAEQVQRMEKIKAWRSVKAAELQIPVFMILPNLAIENIAIEMPENLTQMTALKGMGPIRAGKYGPEILELLKS